MKNQRMLLLIYCVIFCGVIAVAILSTMLKLANNQYHATENQRYVSYNLADELRQSSDDLTRFARTFVVTGNPQYEKMYWDVLNIRDGRTPRSDHYERVYWDLVLHHGDKPRPDVKAVSLKELMKNAGFTATEFAKLSEAQRNSDALVKTEEIAMNMVKGLYVDEKGNFTKRGTPNLDVARQLMHDGAYHQHKASIMKPIGEFQKIVDERTQGEALRIYTLTRELFWALVSTLLILFGASAGAILLKRKQDTLFRESERRHCILINSIPDLIWLKDIDGVYLSCNNMFERFFGAQCSDICGKTDYDFVDKELADFFREHDRNAMNANEPTSNEEWIVFADDGHRALLETVKTPMYDEGGKVIGVLGIGHDITERKEVEDKLNEAFVFNQQIINCAQQGIIVYDLELRYRVWNPFMEQLTGLKAADVLGQNPLEVFPFLEDSGVLERLKMILEGKTVDNIEFPFHEASTGKSGWVSDISAPLFNAVGETIGIIGIVQNLTEQRKTQNLLHQAQKLESIGSLAGGIAHDFNNKLSVILGYAQLAQLKADPESEIQSSLQQICKAAEQSADLTRQLLAFARKQTITPKILDLNETITGMLKMLKRLIGEDIILDWQTKSDLWPINFDPAQIDQILANLCVNARDSVSGNGMITIETGNSTVDESYVTQYPDTVAGDYVRIAVSDNGCGMNKETIDRIFEPFFTTKEAGKGTGLGLATVFGIVKQNNGFINVYSEPGIGTTFTIYVPRYRGNSEQTQQDVSTVSAPHGHETILLVEDELAILNMTVMLLTRQGYTVLPANSATEALRLAQENAGRIHLLITDVIMPEMNGKELTHTVQSQDPHIKSIFMSGYTADTISQHGVLEKGVNFIQKPFLLADLARKVRDVLDNK